LLSAWLILGLTLAFVSFTLFGKDFRGYYAAARVLTEGGNPYDYRLVARVLLDVTGEMGNNPYYYPPWFAWLFIPLTYLPFQVARAIWMTINLVLWDTGLWWLGEIVGWPQKGWQRYGFFALTTFSFAWITWRYEQAGILVFAILVALILSVRAQNWTWSGIWMAILLIKPNVTVLIVAGISLWLLRKGQWRAVLVMLVTQIVLLLVSTWITPDWFRPFLDEGFGQGLTMKLDGPDRVVALRINTTFLDWLMTLGIGPQHRMLVYGILILAGMFVFLLVVFRSESFLQLISVLSLVSFAITPYALQYDYPSLVVALFWSLSLCVSSTWTRGVAWTLALFVFSVIFWQQNVSWAYWMVVGLTALSIWGSYQKSMKALA